MILSTAFFIHELFPSVTDEYKAAELQYQNDKKVRTAALTKVKNLAKGTPEYIDYQNSRALVKESFGRLKDQEIADKFLGFTNLQQFLGEFGWALGLTFYALVMLIQANFRVRESKGEYILHGTLLSIGLFYVYYTLQPFQDFNKFTYIVASIFTSIFTVFAFRFILRERKKYIQSLISNIKSLVSFVLKNTKENKENQMWGVLEKVAEDE